jgi:glycosyltransferase involved in cell wall biosynthesis
MLSKALVTSIYQTKLEELAKLPDLELLAVVPPYWLEGRVGTVPLVRREPLGYELVVEPMRFNGRHHVHYYPGLWRHINAFRPDLVHVDEEPYNLVAAHATLLARRAKARTVFFTWQNLHRRYPPPFRLFERYNYRKASAAIAGNQAAADVLRRKGFRKTIEVIPQFGVDPVLFRPPRPGERPVPEKREPTVGYVGRLVPEKGVETLIEAVALLPGRLRIVIIGTGEHRIALEHLAEGLGIRDRVFFRGGVRGEDLPAAYWEMNMLVVPSRTLPNWKEQFGRVIVEAMACEVPVVGSESGEIPHVIGEAGLTFPEDDAEALALRIDALLQDQELAGQLAAAGRRRVLARYTHARIAAETHRLYRQVLEEAPRRRFSLPRLPQRSTCEEES